MPREAKSHRASRKLPLAVLASLLIAGLFSAGPAGAHAITRTDGNDSPGKLDLRSTSVSHTPTGVVHKVTTYGTWSARSLGNDSFFIIQIDKNNDRNYERCAFIFFAGGRLRGSLTNCGNTFIRYLPVGKLSGTTAKITIPKSLLTPVYWWGVASLWDGPAPCGNGCVDFVPNTFPDVLHDLTPPVVTMTTAPLRVWESSTNANFTFPFTVSDAHSGIKSWTVQGRPVGSVSWTVVVSGTGGGAKSPDIAGVEGTRTDYRVVATDKHGNRRIGPTRRVYIPLDDDTLGPEGVFSDVPIPVDDAAAFGGTYSEMSSGTFTYTWTPGTDCLFELIGPTSGNWDVTVTPAEGLPTDITDEDFVEELPRQTLFSDATCVTSYLVTLNSGTFGLDAVLG